MKLYPLFYTPFLFLLSFFKFFNSKLKKGFELRQSQNKIKPWLNFEEGTNPIWFHCASGEFEYAKPVIRLLKQTHPHLKVLVTFFSPSVLNSIKENPDVDFFCPTPWDTKNEWQEFIDFHKPKALLVARTDLWPKMLETTKKNKIPRLLFSKTTKKHRSFLKRASEKWLLPLFSDIFCSSELDRKHLQDNLTSFDNVYNSGDTRYDQCLFRLQNGKTLKPLKNFNRPIFVAGSTWPSDEIVLLPTIIETISEISFVLAPHEPTAKHLAYLTELLVKNGLRYQIYSKAQNWDPSCVLIIDEVGILADLYAWGDFAFIGGSMDRSVHSVMEPLAQGSLCFIGPEHENNREALLFQFEKVQDMTPVQVVANSDIMLRRFQSLYPSWNSDSKLNLKLKVREKAGASQIVLRWIENNIKTEAPSAPI